MRLDELPEPTRVAIEELSSLIKTAVDATSVHTKHVVHAWLDRTVLVGASIPIQARKPVKYDKKRFRELVRTALEEETLRSLIITCERSKADERFELTTKLVSRAEYNTLAKKRASIDKQVQALLRSLEPKRLERRWFGRSKAGGPVVLTVRGSDGVEKPEPSAELLTCLSEAEKIYETAGHELLVAVWSREGKVTDFREYFE